MKKIFLSILLICSTLVSGQVIKPQTPSNVLAPPSGSYNYFFNLSAGNVPYLKLSNNTITPFTTFMNLSTGGAATWGAITGTLSSQTDLQSALNAKQNLITTGTTLQYFRGDLSLATFPTNVSSFVNDVPYATASTVWSLLGNSGTTISNYLGTSDNFSLRFRINNIQRMILDSNGYLGIGLKANNLLQVKDLVNFDNTLQSVFLGQDAGKLNSGLGNVYIGYLAGDANVSGYSNIGIGASALGLNNSGIENIAIGNSILIANITGSGNIGIGVDALTQCTSSDNIAIGRKAGFNHTFNGFLTAIGSHSAENSTGEWNVALGGYSLNGTTTGIRNVAIGVNALIANTTGNFNTAVGSNSGGGITANNNVSVGYYVLNSATSGDQNTSVGSNSMRFTTTGTENSALGANALFSNLGGANNTALGSEALLTNTNGNSNIAVGKNAIHSNTIGSQNIGIGYRSLNLLDAGSYNIAIGGDGCFYSTNGNGNVGLGYYAGLNTTGSYNVFLGYSAGTNQGSVSNTLIIDNKDRASAFNENRKALIVGKFGADSSDQSIKINGALQISDGTQGNDKVFTSDANGIGSWKTFSSDITANAPLSINTSTLSISQATTSTNGYLSSTDWNTFNNKLSTISGIAAGGDLSGTYTNPTVAKINGNSIPSNALGALTNDGSGTLTWVPDIGTTLTAGNIFVGNGSNIATGVLPSLSASAGTFSLATTGVITMPNATTSLRGLLTSADWNTFNGKQDAINGTGFVKATGTTISYDNSTYLTGNQTITFTPSASGDVTGSASGATTLTPTLVIGAGKVTSTMLANGVVGTNSVVLSTGATLTTPTLGVASATSLAITGTAGNGYVSLTTQTATPSAPSSGTRLFSNSNSKLSWLGSANNYVKTFDGGLASADRVYSLPNRDARFDSLTTSTSTALSGMIKGDGANLSAVSTTGTSSVVLSSGASITSPTLTTPALGTPTSGVLTSCTGLPMTTGVTGVLAGANGGTGVANTGSTITLGGSMITTGTATPTLAFPSTARTYTYPNVATTVMGYTAPASNTGTGNIFFMASNGNTTTTAMATEDGFFTFNGSDCIVQDKTTTSANGFQTKSNNGGSGKFLSYGGTFGALSGTSITTNSMTAITSTTSFVMNPTTSWYLVPGSTASNVGMSGGGGSVGVRIGRIDNLHTAPTSYLTIDAGTSSIHPFQIGSGTKKSTPLSGGFDYDGTTLFFSNSGLQQQELVQQQQSRVTAQFDKTNDAALANVTGLTATLVAGKTYEFEATLHTTENVTGGGQFAIGGTATATNIIYEIFMVDNTTNTNTITSRQTAMAGAAGQAGTTSGYCMIKGVITVNAAGTLTCQFAQNTATLATTSSILVGSTFVTRQIP